MSKLHDDFLKDYKQCTNALNSGTLNAKDRVILINNMKISVGYLMVKAKETQNDVAIEVFKNVEEKLRNLEKGE